MILYLNTHIYNDKKGSGAESSPVAACIGGTGRLVSQDEMRCVWRTGRIGRGSFTSHHHMEGSSSLENKRSKAWKSNCPALGGASYKSETGQQS